MLSSADIGHCLRHIRLDWLQFRYYRVAAGRTARSLAPVRAITMADATMADATMAAPPARRPGSLAFRPIRRWR
jgi:hypothetical protein